MYITRLLSAAVFLLATIVTSTHADDRLWCKPDTENPSSDGMCHFRWGSPTHLDMPNIEWELSDPRCNPKLSGESVKIEPKMGVRFEFLGGVFEIREFHNVWSKVNGPVEFCYNDACFKSSLMKPAEGCACKRDFSGRKLCDDIHGWEWCCSCPFNCGVSPA